MTTKKPCPGCQRVGSNRRADLVCGDCMRKIKFAETVQAERQAADLTDYARYRIARNADSIYIGKTPAYQQRLPVCAALLLVAERLEVSEASECRIDDGLVYSHTSAYSALPTKRVALRVADAALLGELQRTITEALESAYAEGEVSGRNWLARLAQGEVSVSEFNAKR